MHRLSGVRWGRLAALGVWLVAGSAFAGKVVVLELTGDRHGRLRAQIEAAVKHAHQDTLVPLATYEKEAARAGLRGPGAMTPAAVRRVSGGLHLSLAVTGAVATSFYVRFLDANGQELWSKELQSRRGLVSPANAQRLAKAIAAAVRQVEATPPASDATPPAADEGAQAPEDDGSGAQAPETTEPPPDTTSGETAAPVASPQPSSSPPAPGGGAPTPSTPALTPAQVPPAASATPPSAIAEGPSALPRPPWIRLLLLGSTNFRSYCARPGVSSCGAYDALDAGARQPGPTVDFSPQVPYAGFDLGLEVFPLAGLDSAARGLGILGEYHRGFELTTVRPQGQTAQAPETQANSKDTGYRIEAAYRWYFARGPEALTGYLGGRAGYLSQAFDVDKTIAAILPGAHNRGATVGVDFAFPLARWFRAEAGVEVYPHLITGADETVGFGSTGSGFGYGFRVGPSGQLWGPLGYTVDLRYTHVSDTFEGQGVAWQTGGVAQETYLTIHWGLTVQL